jgi:hypothetical protein
MCSKEGEMRVLPSVGGGGHQGKPEAGVQVDA